MRSEMRFEYLTPVTVEESFKDRAIISGTLLVKGISRNKNFYDILTLREVAESAVEKPIFYGTTRKIDVNTGLFAMNMHDNKETNRIGKVLRTVFNKKRGFVKFIAEVWNTTKFPDIVQKLKAGFGISMGGMAYNASYAWRVVNGIKKLVTNIAGMVVNHVQLVSPYTTRGQDRARVESVEIQESMVFRHMDTNEPLTLIEIASIVVALEEKGEL